MLRVLIRILSSRRFWVPTTYLFMKNWQKLSFNYHQIPSLSVLLVILDAVLGLHSFLVWCLGWGGIRLYWFLIIVFIPHHTKSGEVLCYTLQKFLKYLKFGVSVHPPVCPSALHFRTLTGVVFDRFSSNFAWTLILGRSGLRLQMG